MVEYIEEIIRMLVTCVQSRSLYPAGHVLLKKEEDVLFNKLEGFFAKNEEIAIGIIGDEFVFGNVPLCKLSASLAGFTADLKKKGVEKIVFTRGLQARELGLFIDMLAQKTDEKRQGVEFAQRLSDNGLRHIVVGKIYSPEEGQKTPELDKRIKEIYNSSLSGVEDIAREIAEKKRIVNIEKAHHVVGNVISGLLKNKASLLILTSIKKHDEHTFVHAINVAILVLVQSESLELSEKLLSDIGVGALLHDVGKLAVSGQILKKPGSLTDKELDEIHTHPIAGAKMLVKTEGLTRLASVIAFEHHIKYDMTGYPTTEQKYRYAPTLGSMLTYIADYYDACRSHRSYRKGLPPEEIYKDMTSKAGKDFDPDLLAHFFKVIGVYPAGTLVLLDTGETAMVLDVEPADISRPKARILRDTQKKKQEETLIVNLMDKDESGRFKRSIVKSISPSEPENDGLIPSEYMEESSQ